MRKVKRIVDAGLCLGCGLCEAVSGCGMHIDAKGFYIPDVDKINDKEDKTISQLCPSVNIVNKNKYNTDIWGHVESVTNAWAKDPMIRESSSSGGVTSALAIYLLESGKVDGVLQVGREEDGYLYNKLFVSRTREDVLRNNASRYAPALVFPEIFRILDDNPTDTFAFIGKPCDIAAIRNLQQRYPQYKNRIKYALAIFCAGMPGYKATEDAIATFNHPGKPVSLRYRGDGWPGYFTVKYPDGKIYKMTYNESWGMILGRQLGMRCKICPDGIGLLADIASGDSWNTKDGYPDFTEAAGRNFCFVRTTIGQDLIAEAEKAGYIEAEKLDVSQIKSMQPYQYERRRYVGWRILMLQLYTKGLLKFNGLSVYKLALKSNYIKGLKDAKGTYLRLVRQNRTDGKR